MALAPRSGPNLASKLGLSRPDPTTARAIESLGYQFVGAPNTNDHLLGAGAFASVYYAVSRSKRPVAIKVFHDTTEVRDLFENEVQVLEDPRFPADFGPALYCSYRFAGAQPFLVMEFVRGEHFVKHCSDNKLSLEQRCELAEQFLQGLAKLHSAGFAHRDLHSRNVLVTANRRVRLIDYGGSATIPERNKSINAVGNLTNTAPEVLRGKRGDDRDDVFSAAGLIIHALIDEPMPANSTISGDPQHLQKCAEKLRERRIPRPLQRGLLRALGPSDERPSAAGLAAQLADWRLERPQRRRRRLQNSLMALMLLVLCGLAAFGYWDMQRGLAWAEHSRLSVAAAGITNRDHEHVQPLLAEAAALVKHTPVSPARLLDACDRLRQAIDGSRAVDLGRAVNSILQSEHWLQDAPQINAAVAAAHDARDAADQLLADHRGEEAARQYQEILTGLPALVQRNVQAREAAISRQSCEAEFDAVAARLMSLPEFQGLEGDAAKGQKAWTDGDFANASTLYGLAHDELLKWLSKAETEDETEERLRKVGGDAGQHALLSRRVRELETSLEETLVASEGLKTQFAEAQASLMSASTELATVKADFDMVQQQLAATTSEHAMLTQTVNGLRTEVTVLTGKRDQLQKSVATLTNDVATKDMQLKLQKDAVESLQEKVKGLDQQLVDKQKEVDGLTPEVKRLNEVIEALRRVPPKYEADFTAGIPEGWVQSKGSKFMVRSDLPQPSLISNGDSGQHVITLPRLAGQVVTDQVDWTADAEMYVFGTDRQAPVFELRIGKDIRIPVKEYRSVIEVAGRNQPPELNWTFFMARDLKDGGGTLRVKYSAKDKKVTVGMLRLDSGEFFEFNSTDVKNFPDKTIQIVLGAEGNASGGLRSFRIAHDELIPARQP